MTEPKKSAVSLHIERLVLDGLPVTGSGSTAQVQIAVQNELMRLLNQNEIGRTGYTVHSTIAPGFQIVGDPSPSTLGRNIAHSIFHSLMRST
jgi:hypothetical protein